MEEANVVINQLMKDTAKSRTTMIVGGDFNDDLNYILDIWDRHDQP